MTKVGKEYFQISYEVNIYVSICPCKFVSLGRIVSVVVYLSVCICLSVCMIASVMHTFSSSINS